MMIQYTIIATILAACILYAAFRIYKSLQQANKCKDGNYRCSGCAFYEQCKKKSKPLAQTQSIIKHTKPDALTPEEWYLLLIMSEL